MGPVHSEIIIMKAFIFATVLAVATAIPIEDTDEVKAAKAEHAAAHAEANARVLGEAVASAYLADLPEVVEAKAAFQAVFDKYAAGEVALPVAPVHEVPAVVAPAAVAPVAYPYAHGYATYPFAHGYPYAHGYAGYPYAGYYGGSPYALPTVAVAPAKAE